jgi:general secretion pathway protein I
MTVKNRLQNYLPLIFSAQMQGVKGQRQRGFSLLEALVAMAIASIALASLYRSVGQSSKTSVDVESRIEAALVARSVLASSTFAEDIERQPVGAAKGWNWRIEMQPEQIPLREVDGQPVPGVPIRAAKITVEVARSIEGPPIVTWTTWKPYRSVP